MYTTYGSNGSYYVYDSVNNYTVPSSILGMLNLFATKKIAQIEADMLNKKFITL